MKFFVQCSNIVIPPESAPACHPPPSFVGGSISRVRELRVGGGGGGVSGFIARAPETSNGIKKEKTVNPNYQVSEFCYRVCMGGTLRFVDGNPLAADRVLSQEILYFRGLVGGLALALRR